MRCHQIQGSEYFFNSSFFFLRSCFFFSSLPNLSDPLSSLESRETLPGGDTLFLFTVSSNFKFSANIPKLFWKRKPDKQIEVENKVFPVKKGKRGIRDDVHLRECKVKLQKRSFSLLYVALLVLLYFSSFHPKRCSERKIRVDTSGAWERQRELWRTLTSAKATVFNGSKPFLRVTLATRKDNDIAKCYPSHSYCVKRGSRKNRAMVVMVRVALPKNTLKLSLRMVLVKQLILLFHP